MGDLTPTNRRHRKLTFKEILQILEFTEFHGCKASFEVNVLCLFYYFQEEKFLNKTKHFETRRKGKRSGKKKFLERFHKNN